MHLAPMMCAAAISRRVEVTVETVPEAAGAGDVALRGALAWLVVCA